MDRDPTARCFLAWGRRGVRHAAACGDLVVVVDVLSFATATVTAIAHGGLVYPCAPEEDALALAERVGAVCAVGRRDVPARGGFSLSPLTFVDMNPGTRVVLPSPNGAACSRYGRQASHVFVGALVNAQAVAAAVRRLLATSDRSVTVVPCGERWADSDDDGPLRFAVEDSLGAGAILSYLMEQPLSAEAILAAKSFLAVQSTLDSILWTCESGRELRERGFGDDVRFAAQLNRYDIVPVLCDDWFVAYDGR